MVEAFRSVLVIMPRPPSNPDYEHFLHKTRNYSMLAPFLAPRPPDYLDVPPVSAHWRRSWHRARRTTSTYRR